MGFSTWFATVLRVARRDCDLSQRQLARWSGVAKSTIADAETARGAINLDTAAALLACMGYDMKILGPSGDEIPPMLADQRRDCVGRRFPAHLDLIPKTDDAIDQELRWRSCDPRAQRKPPPSEWTFRLNRYGRDLDRAWGFFGELGTYPHPPPMPSAHTLLELRPTLAFSRHRPERERRARRVFCDPPLGIVLSGRAAASGP